MTVKELIAELSVLEPDAQLVIPSAPYNQPTLLDYVGVVIKDDEDDEDDSLPPGEYIGLGTGFPIDDDTYDETHEHDESEINDDKFLNKLKSADVLSWIDSPEGEAAMDDWFEKIQKEEEHTERWVNKFKEWSSEDIDASIEILMDKYYSDEYRNREYFKCGCEPREPFLWLVWHYATENCPECTDEEYFNCFTGGAYHIGSYVIQIMHGQGSVLRIDKYRQDNIN